MCTNLLQILIATTVEGANKDSGHYCLKKNKASVKSNPFERRTGELISQVGTWIYATMVRCLVAIELIP